MLRPTSDHRVQRVVVDFFRGENPCGESTRGAAILCREMFEETVRWLLLWDQCASKTLETRVGEVQLVRLQAELQPRVPDHGDVSRCSIVWPSDVHNAIRMTLETARWNETENEQAGVEQDRDHRRTRYLKH